MMTTDVEHLAGRSTVEANPPSAALAARITTGLFAALMTLSGLLYVAGAKPIMAALQALGYPVYFLKFLGVAKLLGVVGLLAPRHPTLREWAYAGFTFDLIAAVVSHVATGEASHVGAPLAALALLASSYVFRRRAAAKAVDRVTNSSSSERTIWFGRIVLGAAAALLTSIAFKYITDPIGAVGAHGITLGSGEALTIIRVSGGVFLGIAIVLVACIGSTRRLLAGLGFLAAIAATILAVRLLGLAIDGPAPFTLKVLKPEIVLALLSTVALVFERRRLTKVEAS